MTYLREAVRGHVERMGLRPFAQAFGVPVGQVRSVCDGRAARSDTIERLTGALGLELYVGPPRAAPRASGTAGAAPVSLRALERSTQGLVRAIADAGGDPVPDDLWPVLAARRGPGAEAPDPGPGQAAAGARPVEVVELAAAAGGGSEALGEAVAGRVWFRRDWLDRRGLDPAQCAVIGVRGESMEPLLREGDSILVDRKRRRRMQDRIFVVRTDDGLVVKRAGRGGDGGWLLVSEHPSWGPVPWPADAETIGQAVWTARSLV